VAKPARAGEASLLAGKIRSIRLGKAYRRGEPLRSSFAAGIDLLGLYRSGNRCYLTSSQPMG
jgi:hypothetical protein